MPKRRWTRHLWLALGGLTVAMLAAAVFTLGSLNAPVSPENASDFVILFALSTFIFIAFLIFSTILVRSLVRLRGERRAGILGSRFKTKMVLGAMAVSLLPILFMFFVGYALVNRTLNIWFPRPLEIANQQTRQLLNDFGKFEKTRLDSQAQQIADWLSTPGKTPALSNYHIPAGSEINTVWITNAKGDIISAAPPALAKRRFARMRSLPTGAEFWRIGSIIYVVGEAPYRRGLLMVGREAPKNILKRYRQIEAQLATYEAQRQGLRFYKKEILLSLSLITLLLLFATTWVALRLSRRVTMPIQALVKATQQVARGNLDYRISSQAHDELGTLVSSFNDMAAQLGASRHQIDDFTRSLQQAIEEIERRRKLMETILENIPTGVISLDASGAVTNMNSAAKGMLGGPTDSQVNLPDLLGEDAAKQISLLMRSALRIGVASQELEISAGGHLHHAAVTVSPLGSARSDAGFVVVIDDVTELLRAQKAAAWQEVAQRIAHEIKNPLTPIQLSAQRLLRHLDRAAPARRREDRSDWPQLVAECAGLIEREVRDLESLVNEFSQFVRFPSARLATTDLNAIVTDALDVFRNRLDGITLRRELAPGTLLVKADADLLRRVIINFVDNAAEALEGANLRLITVSTRLAVPGGSAEIEIADTGHGISPEDKDKLFLPRFSTKDRGTGLGLAIASRIINEHQGTIRAEDNWPSGARFCVRLPLAEVPAAPLSTANS